MKKMLILAVAAGLLVMAGSAMAATTDTVNINLLVTPVVVTDLNVAPTYYSFGSVGVGVTTCSITALVLTNDGDVGVTIDKAVWADDEWDLTLDPTTQDGFDLWAVVAAAEPDATAYETAKSSFNENGLGDSYFNALTQGAGTAVDMSPTGGTSTANLWFRLDMPQSVTNTNEQTVHVRLRANPQ